jgi:hypothetical protein
MSSMLQDGLWFLNGHSNALRNSTLSTRGWALQEQLLARRIVHFTDSEIIWECSAGLHSESGRTSYLQLMDLARLITNPNAMQFPEPQQYISDGCVDQNINRFLRTSGVRAVYWVWRQIVVDYSRRSLAHAQDKLVALSGIARVLANRLSINPEGSYLAGLWKDSLIQDLLWKVDHEATVKREVGKDTYTAPSWSWASLSGPVSYFFPEYQFRFESLVEVLDASCTRISADPTGAVAGGALKITGWLQPITLEIQAHPEACHQRCSPTVAFIYEPDEGGKIRVFLDQPLEIGMYTQGYQCLELGAHVDTFTGARRTWLLVVEETSSSGPHGLRVLRRTGIGSTCLADWTTHCYSDWETVILG